jgi:poly(A) polymerase
MFNKMQNPQTNLSQSANPKSDNTRPARRSLYDFALSVVKILQRKGYQAYFAGGCVRDKLMELTPSDYDVATDARPEAVTKLFKKTISVGKAFGVITVIEKGYSVEVTTFRTEGPYSNGRHPDEVKFTSLENDVLRRDFTINGLLHDPIKNKLIDLVEGQVDIKHKIIKTIGDAYERFKEDKLRMMRAVRFATELGFILEEKTKSAIKESATTISAVSAERIREELKRILTAPNRAKGIELLDEVGLLNHILPEVAKLKGVAQPVQFHPEGDVYTHTLLCLKYLENPSWELALATLLHDVGKPSTFIIKDRIRFHEHERVGAEMAFQICDRLKLSNAEKEKVVWLVDRHMVFKDVDKMRVSTLKRLFRQLYYQELTQLHKVDRLASDQDLKPHQYCAEMFQKFSQEELKPKPLINGYDLINLGMKPGPLFSVILKKLEEAQLENKVKTKKEALSLVKRLLRTDLTRLMK